MGTVVRAHSPHVVRGQGHYVVQLHVPGWIGAGDPAPLNAIPMHRERGKGATAAVANRPHIIRRDGVNAVETGSPVAERRSRHYGPLYAIPVHDEGCVGSVIVLVIILTRGPDVIRGKRIDVPQVVVGARVGWKYK